MGFLSRANLKTMSLKASRHKVEVRLLNSQTNAANATVTCEIISPAGKSLKKVYRVGTIESVICRDRETGNKNFLAGSLVT